MLTRANKPPTALLLIALLLLGEAEAALEEFLSPVEFALLLVLINFWLVIGVPSKLTWFINIFHE